MINQTSNKASAPMNFAGANSIPLTSLHPELELMHPLQSIPDIERQLMFLNEPTL